VELWKTDEVQEAFVGLQEAIAHLMVMYHSNDVIFMHLFYEEYQSSPLKKIVAFTNILMISQNRTTFKYVLCIYYGDSMSL